MSNLDISSIQRDPGETRHTQGFISRWTSQLELPPWWAPIAVQVPFLADVSMIEGLNMAHSDSQGTVASAVYLLNLAGTWTWPLVQGALISSTLLHSSLIIFYQCGSDSGGHSFQSLTTKSVSIILTIPLFPIPWNSPSVLWHCTWSPLLILQGVISPFQVEPETSRKTLACGNHLQTELQWWVPGPISQDGYT